MELIDYTQTWLEGEIFEGKCILAFGIVSLLFALAFWRFGVTEYSRAIVIPLVVVGVFWSATGVGGLINNHHRIETYQQAYEHDADTFLETEKARVADFMKIYPAVIVIGGLLMLAAILGFAFSDKAWIRATSVVMIYMALSLYTVDYFSKERGVKYQQELTTWENSRI